jgi:hypothetical protein
MLLLHRLMGSQGSVSCSNEQHQQVGQGQGLGFRASLGLLSHPGPLSAARASQTAKVVTLQGRHCRGLLVACTCCSLLPPTACPHSLACADSPHTHHQPQLPPQAACVDFRHSRVHQICVTPAALPAAVGCPESTPENPNQACRKSFTTLLGFVGQEKCQNRCSPAGQLACVWTS